ncbi:RNA-directed DNA polymerase from mobile element jockey-like [Brachionus plicatilis]|uniref:RNA-directed DNA polymerase from mobile element jockey-like n=1 Tax=Brachionus plicatilis TaxID=10195 RepID=A0A3M7R8H0_BRAPC|nr:RNA-directed DNA polymerase from mobile element jockey-like [Brachionus plicatilis]
MTQSHKIIDVIFRNFEDYQVKIDRCSIDASRAFDKVNRNNLWGKMVFKVEPYILRTLVNYYSVSKIVIVINDKTTSLIKTTKGVKQGGPLSPSLFSIYVDDLGDDLDQDDNGIKIGQLKINNIFYADDVILIVNSIDELNRLLQITESYGRDFEIKFNPDKTSYMILFDTKSIDGGLITFQDQTI